jgi:transcriptional regulator of arginine metabolism
MSNTAARRRAIRRIIEDQVVGSQAELVEQLGKAGFEVTQATVSRDLKEIGAVKVPEGAGARYVLPESAGTGGVSDRVLAHTLAEYVTGITSTGNLVVVKTPPGAAQVVAAAIDGCSIDGIIGTVAGDDTLLIVTHERVGSQQVRMELERIGASS